MKSARARWRAHRTLGATRRWTTTGYATAQWKARSARRCPPPPGPTLTNGNFFSFCGGPNPCPLDQSSQAKHHHFDPRKQTPGGRHQIGTPAGFKSESVAGFLLECVAGFVGIRSLDASSIMFHRYFSSRFLVSHMSAAGFGKRPPNEFPADSRARSFILLPDLQSSCMKYVRIVLIVNAVVRKGTAILEPFRSAQTCLFASRYSRDAPAHIGLPR